MAARELLAFLSSYTQLMEQQLNDIRKHMADTVNDVMISIDEISKKHGEKTQKANVILVKDSKDSGAANKEEGNYPFQEAKADEIESAEVDRLKEELSKGAGNFSENVREVGGKLKHHMNSLKNLDGRMQDLLMTMMGALSADDVVGQRLAHVNSALSILRDGLGEIVGDLENKFRLSEIQRINADLEQKVFDSYTMEDEKIVFKKIYKKAPV